jgi:multidrug efflux pump subunit AcrB
MRTVAILHAIGALIVLFLLAVFYLPDGYFPTAAVPYRNQVRKAMTGAMSKSMTSTIINDIEQAQEKKERLKADYEQRIEALEKKNKRLSRELKAME